MIKTKVHHTGDYTNTLQGYVINMVMSSTTNTVNYSTEVTLHTKDDGKHDI